MAEGIIPFFLGSGSSSAFSFQNGVSIGSLYINTVLEALYEMPGQSLLRWGAPKTQHLRGRGRRIAKNSRQPGFQAPPGLLGLCGKNGYPPAKPKPQKNL